MNLVKLNWPRLGLSLLCGMLALSLAAHLSLRSISQAQSSKGVKVTNNEATLEAGFEFVRTSDNTGKVQKKQAAGEARSSTRPTDLSCNCPRNVTRKPDDPPPTCKLVGSGNKFSCQGQCSSKLCVMGLL